MELQPVYRQLHCHSSYSLLDGAGLPEQIADRLQVLGHDACAITDHGSIFGHPHFYHVLRERGISPVLGCEFYCCEALRVHGNKDLKIPKGDKDGKQKSQIFHITILAKNAVGYQNLLKLSQVSYAEGFYYYPRIDFSEIILRQQGLVVLSGCVGGHLSQLIKRDQIDLAYQWAAFLKEWIEHFYIEIVPCPSLEDSLKVCPLLWKIAEDLKIPAVVTDDAHFPRPEDHRMEDAMVMIGLHSNYRDEKRYIRIPEYHYYCSGAEALERARKCLPKVPLPALVAAVERSAAIARMCEVELPHAEGPLYHVPEGITAMGLLKQWVAEGRAYRRSLGLLPPEGSAEMRRYAEREAYELDIIAHHGFENYFLIVSDLCRWAKSQNYWAIARGSCGGSLLCWYLNITQVDPIKFDLPVERFIDKTRSDMPDIDLDFDSRYRDAAFQYLTQRYGEENCAQIAALSKFRAKQSLLDIAKVFQIDPKVVQQLKLLIPEASADEGIKATGILERAFETDERVKAILERYPQMRLAAEIEGQFRQQTIHAAGFVIDRKPLHETLGIVARPGHARIVAADMEWAAKIGLLKIDGLSVRMLSAIAETLEAIGKDFDWLYRLPMDDAETYRTLAAGRNIGVFQLQGASAGKLLRQLRPTEFRDIIAASGLCRPGPLQSGGAQEYVERKHGRMAMPAYHPAIMACVADTYGVILYQEQVMRIMREVGGFEWPVVHKIRKLVSKSKGAGALEPYKPDYLVHAARLGIPEDQAAHLWQQVLKAGNYLFNACVTGDTVVYRPNHPKGGPITVRELYEAQQSRTPWGLKIRCGYLTLMQMDADGCIRPRRLKKIYSNGVRPTLRIVTASGKEIVTTANHRLLTGDGYKQVGHLTLEDRLVIALPKETANPKPGRDLRGKSYGSRHGVPPGPDNPAWIDGRTQFLKEAQLAIRARAAGVCEFCGLSEEGRFEAAHVQSLEACDGDYRRYHSAENLKWLCNSCHKRFDYQKGERVVRNMKGLPTGLDPIVSITPAGLQEVFDIEMSTEEHNYLANGIVSHNSHNTQYAQHAYWSAYLKTHYPADFTAIFAKYETDDAVRQRLFQEFKEQGGRFVLIDPNASKENFLVQDRRTILGGFINLRGIGEISAKALVMGQPYADWEAFYAACPKQTRELLQATGVQTGTLDADLALAIAPWYVDVQFDAVERAAVERYKPVPCAEVPGSAKDCLVLVGRMTEIVLIDTAKEAQKYGRGGPQPGEPFLRAQITVSDESGGVEVHASAWKWHELQAYKKITAGANSGRGNSVLFVVNWSRDRTRLYLQDALLLRESRAYEAPPPPPKTKRMTKRDRELAVAQMEEGGWST